MRIFAAVLLISTSPLVWGQPGADRPAVPATPQLEKLFSAPLEQKQTFEWKAGKVDSMIFDSPAQHHAQRLNPPEALGKSDPMVHFPTTPMDQGMLHHPLPGAIGSLPPGKPILPNLFPNLRLQRIETSGMEVQLAKLQPLPTVWPNLKIEPIPVTWPKFTLLPVKEAAKAGAEKSGK